ncbi:YeeE/YedE family protein, partial [Fischerella thermalis CCMEE 5319]
MTNSLIDFIMKPWPWWFSGTMIAVVMFIITFFGKSFGFSSNLRTICTLAGAGKKVKFFDFDWKTQSWNLLFLVGTFIGGFVAKNFLSYQ